MEQNTNLESEYNSILQKIAVSEAETECFNKQAEELQKQLTQSSLLQDIESVASVEQLGS